MQVSSPGIPACAGLIMCGMLAVATPAQYPGQVSWGRNGYVEYVAGNAPVILTMPHGGYLRPPSVKDRTWGVITRDQRTQEVGRELAAEFRRRFGTHPHLVISHLHRIKLDPNREIVEAAQGDPVAEQAWRDFHGFIAAARRTVASDFGRGLLVDVHGHGHPQDWVEIGYLLSATDLNQSNAALNSATLIAKSSIRHLAGANGATPFAEIVRGTTSLGGLLQTAGVDAVPGTKFPGPGANSYFRGGYDVARWGSRDGGTIDAVQFEFSNPMRTNPARRGLVVRSLVAGLGVYFDRFYQRDLTAGPRITIVAEPAVGSEAGDPAGFKIARTGSTNAAATIRLLVEGRATAGTDYVPLPATVSIPAGESVVQVPVLPAQDAVSEGAETVTVTLLPGVIPIGWPNTATAILVDDEPDPDLVGHWPLDESSGTVARDVSGASRDGALLPARGGPSHVPGHLSRALAFDEVDDHVVIPDFDYAQRTQFTLSFWFRSPQSSQSSTQYYFSHGSVLGANSLNIYRFEQTGLLRTWLRCRTDVANSVLLDVTTDFMDDRWHLYTLTVAPGFGFASVFVDGVRQARGLLRGDTLNPPGGIHVGGRQDGSPSRFLRGSIDDVMLRRRWMSAAEVAELFASSAGYSRNFGASCSAPNQPAPAHLLVGRPALGARPTYWLTGALSATQAAFFFGFSRSRFGGVPLPLDLTVLGAPSCVLLQGARLRAPVAVQQGTAQLRVVIPNDAAARGVRVFSQAMVIDATANAAGFVVTNGVETVIGG